MTGCLVATNAAIAERYADRRCRSGRHEVTDHSTDIRDSRHGLGEAAEREVIAQSLVSLETAPGIRPRGWLSPAGSHSWNTPRLPAEAGVEFMCDWVNDEMSSEMATPAGRIVNLLLCHELGIGKFSP